MPAKPIRSSRIADDPPQELGPLLPTLVVASYKGGVGKTAIAVAIAERLGWAGLRVLMLTCDSQEDARARLGVKPSEPQVAHRPYGQGCVTVVGIRGSKAIDLLYRFGPERLGIGTFDVAILDTPPEVQGGSLPGVLLITPVDGMDAARNLLTMLRRTPANTHIVLVRLGRADSGVWAQNVEQLEEALGRNVEYLPDPLPRTKRIHEAHDEGKSVWTLRRTGRTLLFLCGIDALALAMWNRVNPRQPWPDPPRSAGSAHYVPGWDDED